LNENKIPFIEIGKVQENYLEFFDYKITLDELKNAYYRRIV